jgi:paraquat-inducible protein B
MSTQEWTQLVQQVDRLIAELKQTKSEAQRWRMRATELESVQRRDDHTVRLEEQAKDRELERLRKERVKTVGVIERILLDLDKVEAQVLEMEDGA